MVLAGCQVGGNEPCVAWWFAMPDLFVSAVTDAATFLSFSRESLATRRVSGRTVPVRAGRRIGNPPQIANQVWQPVPQRMSRQQSNGGRVASKVSLR